MDKARVGKIIIITIATISIVMNSLLLLFNILFAFSFVGAVQILVRVAFAIALLRGVTWVRYLFAVGAALGALLSLFLLLTPDINFPTWATAFYLFMLPYSIISSVLLFTSKSVTEYFYELKHEGI